MNLFGKTKKISTLTGGQRGILDQLTNTLSNQIGQAGPQYTGPIVPTDNATQQQAFQLAGGLGSRIGQTDQAINSMLQGQSAIGQDTGQYYQDAVLAPAQLAYRDAQKDLEARYGGTWGQTGGYQDIMQEGAARFGTGIGSIMANLARQDIDRANDLRSQGVSASFGQTQDIGRTLDTMLSVGGEQRAQAGEKNQDAYNRWQSAQAYNNPWLGLLGSTLGTSAFAVGQERGLLSKLQQVGSMAQQARSASKPSLGS